MAPPRITSTTTLPELAAIVSETLEAAGIVATLSGGSAVSLYTENRYESEDLDFVTTAMPEQLKTALEPLGFVHTGSPRLSVFEHPSTRWYLEFPPAPLSFGGTYVDASDCDVLSTTAGRIRIITPTQAVMDRLSAAVHWQDLQSFEQAVLVAIHQADRLDWKELGSWARREGITTSHEIVDFYRRVNRTPDSV